jgi:dCMP deaminase
MDIPSWNEYFMQMCNVVKLRSRDPKKQVGSILVSDDNRIISTGYNALKKGSNDNIDWDNRDLVHLLVLHAEVNCLLYATSRFENTTLYSTLSPCNHCIKLIASSGVKKIIYQDKYKDYDSVKEICNFYEIDLIQFNKNNESNENTIPIHKLEYIKLEDSDSDMDSFSDDRL